MVRSALGGFCTDQALFFFFPPRFWIEEMKRLPGKHCEQSIKKQPGMGRGEEKRERDEAEEEERYFDKCCVCVNLDGSSCGTDHASHRDLFWLDSISFIISFFNSIRCRRRERERESVCVWDSGMEREAKRERGRGREKNQ